MEGKVRVGEGKDLSRINGSKGMDQRIKGSKNQRIKGSREEYDIFGYKYNEMSCGCP
jgi:hypothetical protein